MKPELKKRWVKALRSGEFKKGKSYLKQNTPKGPRHCCLGVLCEIQNARMTLRVFEDAYSEDAYMVGGYSGDLSPSYQKRYGVPEETMCKLINMNDIRSWSFNRIATWIEKNL